MQNSRPSLKDIPLLLLGFLLNMSPLWAFTLMLLIVSVCGFFYYSLNSDFFGLAAPPFAELSFLPDFTSVRDTKDERSWKISYESAPSSTFHGVVRHVST
jgi:hypothetical protein